MKALLIAHGSSEDSEFVSQHAHTFDLIVVTDGAVHRLPHDVKPSVVCGDFDSIDHGSIHPRHADAEFIRTPDQEMSDLEKALVIARERGAKEVAIVGGFGGRIDHSLANLSVMIRYHSELPIVMVHGGAAAWLLSAEGHAPNPYSFDAAAGDTVSIVPLTANARVRAENVEWPLKDETLHAGSRGVSNRALGGQVTVEVRDGLVMICHQFRSV